MHRRRGLPPSIALTVGIMGPSRTCVPLGLWSSNMQSRQPGQLGVCFKREGAEAAEDVTSRGRQALTSVCLYLSPFSPSLSAAHVNA